MTNVGHQKTSLDFPDFIDFCPVLCSSHQLTKDGADDSLSFILDFLKVLLLLKTLILMTLNSSCNIVKIFVCSSTKLFILNVKVHKLLHIIFLPTLT